MVSKIKLEPLPIMTIKLSIHTLSLIDTEEMLLNDEEIQAFAEELSSPDGARIKVESFFSKYKVECSSLTSVVDVSHLDFVWLASSYPTCSSCSVGLLCISPQAPWVHYLPKFSAQLPPFSCCRSPLCARTASFLQLSFSNMGEIFFLFSGCSLKVHIDSWSEGGPHRLHFYLQYPARCCQLWSIRWICIYTQLPSAY